MRMRFVYPQNVSRGCGSADVSEGGVTIWGGGRSPPSRPHIKRVPCR